MGKGKRPVEVKETALLMNDKSAYLSATPLLPEGEIDRPVVFLTEPYITESVKMRLKDVGYEIMPEIWNAEYHLQEVNEYLERIYVSLRQRLGSVLSQIHQVDYPASFWEIPLAPWLLHYLHILFDRYSRLKRAAELYGKENVVLFACKGVNKLPADCVDFIDDALVVEQSISSMYAAIANLMGIRLFEFVSSPRFQKDISIRKGRRDFLSGIFYAKTFDRLKDGFLNPMPLRFFEGKDVLMSPSRFNRQDKVIFAKKLKASFISDGYNAPRPVQRIDRTQLLSIKTGDEFEKVAVGLLPRFMPQHLLEAFKWYDEEAKKMDYFKIYFAAANWRADILFCYAASHGRLKGAKVVGCQHGGGYGQDKKCPSEFMERLFCDYYITWGWRDSSYPGAQLLPLPQPNLSRYLNKHRPKAGAVLWSSTTMPKQLVRFVARMPSQMSAYLETKKAFISNLDKRVRKSLIYRPHPGDYGWPTSGKKIFAEHPEVKIECVGDLPQWLQRVKLYICDDRSTSFMEALAANTPTILFWDSNAFCNREGAAWAFDLLRSAGILFYDPIKAAEQVNAIFDDVQGWWLHPLRQNARFKFMEAFCQADVNWQEKWIGAFREMLKKA